MKSSFAASLLPKTEGKIVSHRAAYQVLCHFKSSNQVQKTS